MTAQILGRDEELRALLDRLRHRRLVTVVGPGGIGKTALAGVAAASVAPEYAYGSVTVDLTRVDRPEGVYEAIAAQLGCADFPSLLDSPSDQPALVLVDNCEHVLDAAADAIDQMLAACRMPTVLATSRAPLALPDEAILAIGPLATPDEGSLELDTPAMRLLAGRVRDQGVEPDELDPLALAEICRRLDGVPLALELAAARLRSTSPRELLTELDERPHALARRRFRGQASHRSVAEVVGWSTALLDPPVRMLFDRLGVFAGPFTAAMAVSVAAPVSGEGIDDPAAVNEALAELVDASLVVADSSGDTTWYRLLHPVRAVAVEGLRASGRLDRVQGLFVDQVVAAAVDVIARTSGKWGSDALPDLLGLYDNITASLRWLLEHDAEPDRALTLVAVLWGLVHQAHTAEIGAMGESVLVHWEGADRSPLWPDAVATVATCRTLTARYPASLELAEATLAHADRSPFAPATLRRVLAQTYRILGQAERSLDTFADGARIAAERGVHGFALELLVDVGMVHAELGRPGTGLEVVDEALAEARQRNAPVNEAWALAGRAHVLLDRAPADAARAAAEALARSVEIDYPAGRSCSLRVLARARLAQGDLPGAAAASIELLDELLSRGGLNDLRMMLDVAAGIAHRAGAAGWADLAATARELPITTVMVPVDPGVGRYGDGDGQVLSTRDAYVLARRTMRDIADGPTAPAQAGGEDTAGQVAEDTAGQAAESTAGDPAEDTAGEAALADGVPPADARAGQDPTHDAALVGEGDVIRIEFGGSTTRLRRSKGLVDLARLLARPGQEISCLDLMGAAVTASAAESEAIDATARRQYEDRVRQLQAEIDQAEDDNDLGTAERLRIELDAIVDQLTAALGLGARTRTSSSPAERARSAVTQRLRATVKRIARHDPALGRHLQRSISTGLYCVYRPDDAMSWVVDVS